MKCSAFTSSCKKCDNNALENSKYCGVHQDIKLNHLQELNKNLKERDKKNTVKNIAISIIGLIISFLLFSLGIMYSQSLSDQSFKDTIELSEKSLNKTSWLTSPVELEIIEKFSSEEKRWNLTIINKHPLRNTGTIYLYRVEIDPNKPHMIDKEGLAPNENKTFSLIFEEETLIINSKDIDEMYTSGFTLPSDAYYVNEHASITTKISCDNCPSQGFLRRQPNFGSMLLALSFNNETIDTVMPIYSWFDKSIDDIKFK